MSHEQYLDEPAHVIDWALAIQSMEGDMEEERARREREKAERARR